MMVSYKHYGSRPDCPFRRSLVKTLSVCYRDQVYMVAQISWTPCDPEYDLHSPVGVTVPIEKGGNCKLPQIFAVISLGCA